jgi:hypothetical protein
MSAFHPLRTLAGRLATRQPGRSSIARDPHQFPSLLKALKSALGEGSLFRTGGSAKAY